MNKEKSMKKILTLILVSLAFTTSAFASAHSTVVYEGKARSIRCYIIGGDYNNQKAATAQGIVADGVTKVVRVTSGNTIVYELYDNEDGFGATCDKVHDR